MPGMEWSGREEKVSAANQHKTRFLGLLFQVIWATETVRIGAASYSCTLWMAPAFLDMEPKARLLEGLRPHICTRLDCTKLHSANFRFLAIRRLVSQYSKHE